MQNKKLFFFLVAIIVVVISGLAAIFYFGNKTKESSNSNNSSSEGEVAGVTSKNSSSDPAWIEGLAKTLTEKGMVMYGAYWCSHCNNQKKMFGDAVKYIDYVECDPQGENANPEECKANNVEGYPTWIYEGNRYSGEQPLEKLAEIVDYDQ